MDRVTELLAANSRIVLKGRELKRQLEKARDQFAFYGKEHRTKAEGFRHKATGQFKDDDMKRENLFENAQASDDKAPMNENMAAEINKTLSEYHVVEQASTITE